mmetsp:Transcript_24487/g.97170  ORF Transcript_24487/g.97170 Transcript_24487/m.97170 type:complete len:81 (-) Transcript_24487:402-644(-)
MIIRTLEGRYAPRFFLGGARAVFTNRRERRVRLIVGYPRSGRRVEEEEEEEHRAGLVLGGASRPGSDPHWSSSPSLLMEK